MDRIESVIQVLLSEEISVQAGDAQAISAKKTNPRKNITPNRTLNNFIINFSLKNLLWSSMNDLSHLSHRLRQTNNERTRNNRMTYIELTNLWDCTNRLSIIIAQSMASIN